MEDHNNESNGSDPGHPELRRINPKSPRQAIQPEQAPGPPPRSKQVRHPVVVFLNFLITLVLLAVVAFGGILYWGKQEFEATGPLTKDQTVMVSRGASLESISGQLQQKGLISSSWVFTIAVQVYKNANEMKAGEYLIPANASMRQIMDVIVAGRGVEYAVTLPEGLSSEQIIAILKKDAILVGEIDEIPEEGILLPETYKFTRGTSRQQIVDRMRRDHDKVLADVWSRRDKNLPIASPREMLILASIVEKETGKADERTRVAAVFVNRLRKKMRLESDPTILYGLHGGDAWNRPRTLLLSELKKPNNYNTYQIDGLPPGPIASPGRAALEAVANPSRTNDLFFVADGTGGHVFAETYADHKKNVARWRKVEKDRRDAANRAATTDGTATPKTKSSKTKPADSSQ